MPIAAKEFMVETVTSALRSIAKDLIKDSYGIAKCLCKETLYQFFEVLYTLEDKNVNLCIKFDAVVVLAGTAVLPVLITKHHYSAIFAVSAAWLIIKGYSSDWVKTKARKTVDTFFYNK